MEHHPWDGKWCPSCRRRDCLDFTEAKRLLDPGYFPTPCFCQLCDRKFLGENFCAYHLQRRSRNISPICDTYKLCPECYCTYEVKNAGKSRRPKQHKCGWGECPVYKKHFHIASHQCYIQATSDEEDESKEKRVPRDEVGTRPFREPNPDDYEAMMNVESIQTPILLCAETDKGEETMSFYGPDCTKRFFEGLEELAVDIDGDDREVIVIFHNLKDYDGLFLFFFFHCYTHHRKVKNLINIGPRYCPSSLTGYPSRILSVSCPLCWPTFRPPLD